MTQKQIVGKALNEFVDAVFIVHLEQDIHRKKYCDRVLKEWGIEAEFWKATYWDNLPEPFKNININGETDGWKKRGRKTFAPIIALNCSFSSLFREARSRGYNRILVLEDDFAFTEDFIRFPEFAYNLPLRWDLLRLQYRVTKKSMSRRVNITNYLNDYWATGTKLVTAGAMIYNNLQTVWKDLYGDERIAGGVAKDLSYALHADIRVEHFINSRYNEIFDIHPRALFCYQANEEMEHHITVFGHVSDESIEKSYQATPENSIVTDEKFYPFDKHRLFLKPKNWRYKSSLALETDEWYKILVYRHKSLPKEITGKILEVYYDGKDFIHEDEVVDQEYIYLINQKGVKV